jgi:hypothetical protein
MYVSELRNQFTRSVHTAREFLRVHTVALFADRVVSGEAAPAARMRAPRPALPIALLVLSG